VLPEDVVGALDSFDVLPVFVEADVDPVFVEVVIVSVHLPLTQVWPLPQSLLLQQPYEQELEPPTGRAQYD
jgi:hypothetical protein